MAVIPTFAVKFITLQRYPTAIITITPKSTIRFASRYLPGAQVKPVWIRESHPVAKQKLS